jgi:hypothetical protein
MPSAQQILKRECNFLSGLLLTKMAARDMCEGGAGKERQSDGVGCGVQQDRIPLLVYVHGPWF